MSVAGVADVLTRPKAWALLSWKGREPYVKMLNFLQDQPSIERLKELERRKNQKPIDIKPKVKDEVQHEIVSIRKGSPIDMESEIFGLKRKSSNSMVELSDIPKKIPVIFF